MSAAMAVPGGRATLLGALLFMGAGWGLTQPLTKIAVSGGNGPMGIVAWQLVIGAVLLTAVNRARGLALPRHRKALLLYLFVGLSGTVLPNWASYTAVQHLPAGIMSIVISAVPMFAFPIALMLGTDRFGVRRLIGLSLGITGVALIALPEASLPGQGTTIFVLLALIAPICYAVEGNVVDRWGTHGVGPVQVLQGASIAGAIFAIPLSFALGQAVDPRVPWQGDEWAVVAASCIHATVYSMYVWMVGRAGAVFAAQTSYLVTGCGVLWAMAILGERYPPTVWLALGAMIAGIGLVQPRENSPLTLLKETS